MEPRGRSPSEYSTGAQHHMEDNAILGGCLCGSIRYEIMAALKDAEHCHCSMCRKAHGAAFSTNAVVPTDMLTVTSGADCCPNINRLPTGESASAPTVGHSCSSGASTSRSLRSLRSAPPTLTHARGPNVTSSPGRRLPGTRLRTHCRSSKFTQVSNRMMPPPLDEGLLSREARVFSGSF